jgi:predicted RNA-binding Zn-ribbon protein involved in translation (DUF1610 family)
MRTTQVCPKCGSHDIAVIPGGVRVDGADNIIMVGWTILSSIKVTRYLCCECGFSEEWVDDPEDREKIREKYGSR